MFEGLKKVVKSWMQTTGADTGIAKEFKDIFEISGVPAFREFYNFVYIPIQYASLVIETIVYPVIIGTFFNVTVFSIMCLP